MAGWVRAAAYRPRGDGSGASAPGPDEDTFTFAATALERAAADDDLGPGPVDLLWIGDPRVVPADGFGPLLGTEIEIRSIPRSASALRESLASAAGGGRPALIVAAEWPESTVSPGGAVAFLLRPDSADPEPPPVLATTIGGAVDQAHAMFEALTTGGRARWVGDWTGRSPTQSGPRARGPPAEALAVVSEGAYVPGPRYREGLPSRWRLVAERCGACGTLSFPARGRCRGCGRTAGLRPEPLPRDGGTVVATTWIGTGGQPTEFDPQVASTGPYGVALVELAPGVRATLQMADCAAGELRIGSRVDTRLRRIYSLEREWRYGRKAIPASR